MIDALLERLRSGVSAAIEAGKLARSTGLLETLHPSLLAKAAAGIAAGRRGSMAIIHFHALSDPRRPAVVADGVRLSYGELEERVNRLTYALPAVGVTPGEKVGIFMPNRHEYLELNAALQGISGVAVQIGYRLKAAEVAYLLENSGAKALVFDPSLASVVDEALRVGKNLRLDKSTCFACGDAPGFPSYEALLDRGNPNAPARIEGGGFGGMMIYTSGTTGKSKGATRNFKKLGYETIFGFLNEFPIARDERHLVVCPLYHSAAQFFTTVVMALGGCVVVLNHFDPPRVLSTIEDERITSMMMVPTMYSRLLSLPREEFARHDLSSLRWIFSGAAPLPTDLARRIEDAFGPILYNFYGATETGIVTIAKPGEHTARPGTIGRIVEGNTVRLLDAHGNLVKDGDVGELYAKNPMMMDGYHGNHEATQKSMRDGFFSVGDLAYRDSDGYYYLADRKTDMVISGGVNIYPWEIEQRLHEHPAVMDAAVVGYPDPEWGESLAAFVVLRPNESVTAAELQAFVKETLADFKRPKRVEFLEALPRNPTGKVLKRELRSQLNPSGGSS